MVGAKEVAAVAAVGRWAWENRATAAVAVSRFRRWWRQSRILVIGPGGTGKTTLARILSGEFDWLKDSPWRYDEDVGAKHYAVRGDTPAEVVVLPGQEHRRSATWAGVTRELAAGRYEGVMVVGAYGYHSFPRIGYKDHRLFRDSKSHFMTDLLADRRADEVGCLTGLGPGVAACPRKLWVMTAATKLDLWAAEETAAEAWYRTGEYGRAAAVVAPPGSATVRHEFVPLSSLIGNFVTARGELLRKSTAGFDHRAQVESVRRLIDALDGLRRWGKQT